MVDLLQFKHVRSSILAMAGYGTFGLMAEQTVAARSAHILVNPGARGAYRFDPGDAMDLLTASGLEVDIHVGDDPEHFRALAVECADAGADLLFVVGGDGAVRIAAGAVAGSDTAVAVIPAGTANVWAKEIGISTSPQRAVAQHISGQVRKVDLGRASGEPFLLMASLGWDADVVQQVGHDTKRRLGELAYVAQAVTSLPRLRPVPISWESDGSHRNDDVGMLVVSNNRLYGGHVRFSPQAEADDGILEICAVSPERPGDGLRLAGLLARGHLAGHKGVVTASARRVHIETPGIPYQLDGDLAGITPVTFEVEPDAVLVSLPPGPLPGIFGRAGLH